MNGVNKCFSSCDSLGTNENKTHTIEQVRHKTKIFTVCWEFVNCRKICDLCLRAREHKKIHESDNICGDESEDLIRRRVIVQDDE